jgi:hypothetical protein
MGHLVDEFVMRKKRAWISFYEEKRARRNVINVT